MLKGLGLNSLPGGRTGRPLGSGRSLSEAQAQRIQGLIDEHSPNECWVFAMPSGLAALSET